MAHFAQLVYPTSRESEGSILMAPKITMFNGQTGTLFVGDEQPFCTNVRRSESGAIEPVIESVECGVRLSVSPMALDDGSIEFALGLRTTEIGRIELANLPPLDPTSREGTTVQIPRVAVESVDLSVVLEEGRSLAVAVPKTFDVSILTRKRPLRTCKRIHDPDGSVGHSVVHVLTVERIDARSRTGGQQHAVPVRKAVAFPELKGSLGGRQVGVRDVHPGSDQLEVGACSPWVVAALLFPTPQTGQ